MKSLFKTKSFWIGLAGIVTGISLIVSGDINSGILAIGGGIATITVRDAIRTK